MKQLLRKCKRTIALLSAVLLALSTPAESLVALAVEGDDSGSKYIGDVDLDAGYLFIDGGQIEEQNGEELNAESVQEILQNYEGEKFNVIELAASMEENGTAQIDKDIFNLLVGHLETESDGETRGRIEYNFGTCENWYWDTNWNFERPHAIEENVNATARMELKEDGTPSFSVDDIEALAACAASADLSFYSNSKAFEVMANAIGLESKEFDICLDGTEEAIGKDFSADWHCVGDDVEDGAAFWIAGAGDYLKSGEIYILRDRVYRGELTEEGRLFIDGGQIAEGLNADSVESILANYEGQKFDTIELAAAMKEDGTALIDKDIFNLLVRYIKDDENDPTKKSGKIEYNFGGEDNWDVNWSFEDPNEINVDVKATATMEVKDGKPSFSISDVEALQGCAETVDLCFWSSSDSTAYNDMVAAIGTKSKVFDIYQDGSEAAIEFSAEWDIDEEDSCSFWMGDVGKYLKSGVSYRLGDRLDDNDYFGDVEEEDGELRLRIERFEIEQCGNEFNVESVQEILNNYTGKKFTVVELDDFGNDVNSVIDKDIFNCLIEYVDDTAENGRIDYNFSGGEFSYDANWSFTHPRELPNELDTRVAINLEVKDGRIYVTFRDNDAPSMFNDYADFVAVNFWVKNYLPLYREINALIGTQPKKFKMYRTGSGEPVPDLTPDWSNQEDGGSLWFGDMRVLDSTGEYLLCEEGEEPKVYTIKIDRADGSKPTVATIYEGGELGSIVSRDPYRDGYEFQGWIDGDGNMFDMFDTYRPKQNTTIKAMWNAIPVEPEDPNKQYNMELRASDLAAGTYDAPITKRRFTINAAAGENCVVVDASNKMIQKEEYTARIKTNGAGNKDHGSIKFTAKGKATLTMACMANDTSMGCEVGVATLSGEELVDVTTGTIPNTGMGIIVWNAKEDGPDEYETETSSEGNVPASFVIKAGDDNVKYVTVALPAPAEGSDSVDYYIYSKNGGVNFYFIQVEYADGEDPLYCTVTFDAKGGLTTDSQKVAPGETCIDPGESLRSGHTFLGWYQDEEYTERYDFDTPVTGHLTLHAKWLLGEPESNYLELDMNALPARDYKEKFDKNGFTFMASANKTLTIEESAKILGDKEYHKKLKFNGKSDKETNERSVSFTIEGEATLKLVAESASSSSERTLTISDGISENDKTISVQKMQEYTETLTAGTWYLYAEDAVNIYYLSVTGDGVKKQYVITIDRQDGVDPEVMTVQDGEMLTKDDIPDPTREGYTFIGWKDGDGNEIDLTTGYTPEKNVILKAEWEQNAEEKKYTILIADVVGGPFMLSLAENEQITEEMLKPYTEKEGYDFYGWRVTDDETEGEVIELPINVTGDMTIRAVWTQGLQLCTITINKENGEDSIQLKVKAGATVTDASVPNPVKVGYAFDGWKDEDGKSVDFSQGYLVTRDMTITAQWTKNGTGDGDDKRPDQGNEDDKKPDQGNEDDKKPDQGNGDDKKPGTNDGDDEGDTSGLVVSLVEPGKVYEYTGSAIKPAISVKNNGKALTEGVDYIVKYSNNVKAGEKTAKITITGKNSFTGSAVTEFTIKQKDLNSSDVKKGAIVVVKGSKAVPVLVYNGMKLGAKDYEFVNQDDAKKKFTENGKIKIKGKGNYFGNIELEVKAVERKDLKKFTVEVGKEVLTYNGKSQSPTITVSDKDSKQPLNQTDYIIVPCGDQTSAGTQKFTVVGLGWYSGTMTKSYKIKPLAVTNPSEFTVGGVAASYPFVNGGVTVNKLTVSYKGTPLILGKDYKVTYSNNKKVSGKTDAKYTIAFLGNYKGSKPVSNTFKITPAPLDNKTKGLKIEIADKTYKNPGQYKSTVYVSINGVALKGSDYKAEYYIDPGRTKAMDSKNNKVTVAEGTDSATVYVKITGKGNYASDTFATAEYKVCKADGKTDLSKARVTVVDKDGSKQPKQAYTGRKIEPAVKVEVKVGKNWEIVPSNQYKVAYVNNVNKGKATVIVTGTGTKCVSSKTATFSIVAKNLKDQANLMNHLFKTMWK